MEKMIDILTEIVQDKFELMGYDREYGRVRESDRPDICQFQCNGALSAAKKYRKAPMQIANSVVEELKNIDIFEAVHIVNPGFINFILKDSFIVDYVSKMGDYEKLGCTEASNPSTIIVDYGGANVAKPLHVGHLRAAIIGESIKRISRFLGHKVIGDVHLGDWGLQIGMVISELRRRKGHLPYFNENYYGEYPEEAPFTIDELEEIYPAASRLAKSNEEAMEEARKATFELQIGRKAILLFGNIYLQFPLKILKEITVN